MCGDEQVNIVREWCDAADMARKRVMDVALAIQSPRRLDSSIIDACRSYLQIIQWMRVHLVQSSWLQRILSHKDTWKEAKGKHREEEEENNSESQVPFRFRWILSPLLHGSDIICQGMFPLRSFFIVFFFFGCLCFGECAFFCVSI